MFLVTCGLIFLLTRLPLLGFGTRLSAERAEGTVVAAGEKLLPSDVIALVRGDSCSTGPLSHVDLSTDDSSFRLGSDSLIVIEEPSGKDGPRLRLMSGAITVDGQCVITTGFGVVLVEEGSAEITFLEGELDVRCDSGSLEVVSPLGGRHLAAGERMDVASRGLILNHPASSG